MRRNDNEFIDIPIPQNAGQYRAGYFNLPELIKHGDLDIRSAAKSAPSLKVSEYCGLLSQFTDIASDVLEILENFAYREFAKDRKSFKCMDRVIYLLDQLGCDKYTVGFHFLNSVHKNKNNWNLASIQAEQLIEGFTGFRQRIENAKSCDTAEESDPQLEALFNNGSLKEYIDYLDKNDANRKLVILAIDDSPDILKAIYYILKDEYKVISLPKPLMLEDMLKHITPELFLLDYNMPELNGFDLIPIIRGYDEHKDTPIVFLTAESTIDRKAAAVMLGACDFLQKPLYADELREKIAKYIVRKRVL
jgi:PleD family two-component response regulator